MLIKEKFAKCAVSVFASLARPLAAPYCPSCVEYGM
jgi:hypothetical protein